MFRLQTRWRIWRQVRSVECLQCVPEDPNFFDRDLERYQRVTPPVDAVAVERHLATPRRVALSVVPRDRTELALAGSVAARVS